MPHDLIDVAVADGHFKTFVEVVVAAGLADTLRGAGPFTVLAPTEAAFAKLPAGTVNSLLKDMSRLVSILKYHVLPGKVTAADIAKLDGKTAKTLHGGDLKISTYAGIMINGGIHVSRTDLEASNGVIHVIDSVLLPTSK